MNYFKICLKRMLKATLTLISITVVLLVVGAVLLFMFFSKEKETTAIGVVGNTEDTYINIALSLLEENESFEIISLSKSEAESLLVNNKIQGWAEIPDNFVDSAMVGKNVPFTYTVLKKPSSLYNVITKETVSMVSVLLNESQNSIYGMRQFLKDSSQKALLYDKSEDMSMRYVKSILQRKDLFDINTTGVISSVSTVEYYFAGVIIIFSLLLGASLSPFMIKEKMGLPILLKSRGVSALKQVWCELISFFIVIYSLIFILLSIFALITEIGLIIYAIKLIPVIFLISALQFLIYEMSDSLIGGTLFQFFSSLCFAFISGCFYPSFLFPETIRKIANSLPIGSAFSLSRSLISESGVAFKALQVLLWIAILIVFSALIRKIRIRRAGL